MSKHLGMDDRNQIYIGLETGKPFAQIAKELGKARTTISREIQNHRIVETKGAYGRIKNDCIHRKGCKVYGLCEHNPDCTRKCSSCKQCNTLCHDYEQEHCPRVQEPPYVCNGCTDKQKCVLKKWVYSPKYAQDEYRSTLQEARQGFNLTPDELETVNACVSPLILKGQSVHHICVHNSDSIYVSERTVERLVVRGALTAKNIDRPRACKLKPRKCDKPVAKIEPTCREGRTMQDFVRFCKSHNLTGTVQMDSVIGRIGGKVLLTLIFPASELMLAFLRERNTSQSAIDCIQGLYDGLGHEDFCKLFPAILTDNGSEFTHPSAFETTADHRTRTHIFYCDPMASYQKPQVERNHVFIRQILPHGVSFNALTQSDISLMMSHINSYSRPVLGDKSPFEVFQYIFGDALMTKLLRFLCLEVISPNDICLRPTLLKR